MYLNNKGICDKNGNLSIINTYTKEKLIYPTLIVRDELLNNFIVFKNYKEYISHWKSTLDENKLFHEIIFSFSGQKIKFDIDILSFVPNDKIIIDEINLIIETIIKQFEKYYNIIISYDDIIVTESSGMIDKNNYKYSFHIIICNYYVENNEEVNIFTYLVSDELPENIKKYIDKSVNKQIQNFRLLGCRKKNDNRYKKLSELFYSKRNINYEESIITNIAKSKKLPKLNLSSNTTMIENVNVNAKKIEQGKIDKILQWLKENRYTDDHELRCINGNIISFNRIASTHMCRICNRIHENDNSLFIKIQPFNKSSVSLIEYCHRNPKKYNTLIESLQLSKCAATDAATGPKKSYLQIVLESCIQKHASASANETTFSDGVMNIYSSPYMQPYPIQPDTLCIKAPMGCGKTKALKDYIENYFTNSVDVKEEQIFPQVIRFLTFRQTFAQSLLSSFNDFKLYSDIIGDINQNDHKKVIIQVESLHRIVINKYTDPINLLILDEVESILAQFNSGLHKHFNAAFAAFQWMLMTAEKVICIDANLSERTFNILKRMRPNHEIHFHHNIFKKESENIYKITNNNSEWLSIMLSFLSDGKKIVIPSNSKLEAEVYKNLIQETFPNKKVHLYSSEMANSEKNEHFSDVRKYWSQLDVLIYTPTCSAGISFELDHFDIVFAHFTDASCDVETCRQMLMRVRNVRTKTYYIYFPAYSSNIGNYPTTTEEISSALKSKKIAMFKDIDHSNLQFEYSKDGDIIYFESNYFHLWLENVRIENLSKNNFIERFINQIIECGASVELLQIPTAVETVAMETTVVNYGPVAVKDMYKNMKSSVKQTTANFIATVKDITLEEVGEIQNKKQAGEDIKLEEIYACNKFYIRDIYKFKHPMNKEFVLIYDNENVKKVFRYMSKICSYETVELALADIQQKDIDAYSSIGIFKNEYNYHEGVEYYNLVKYKYTFTNHLSLQELIKICGFHFTDIFKNDCETIKKNKIHITDIEKYLRDNLIIIEKNLILLLPEMNIPKQQSNITEAVKKIKNETNPIAFSKKMIKLINFGLKTFYGIEIEKNSKEEFILVMGKIALLFNYIDELFNCTNELANETLTENTKPNIICSIKI
jgi:hypothetical protein